MSRKRKVSFPVETPFSDAVKRQLEERRKAMAELRAAYLAQHPEAAETYEEERQRVLRANGGRP
jgi:hypothetical protein